jgi:hypothetical protein
MCFILETRAEYRHVTFTSHLFSLAIDIKMIVTFLFLRICAFRKCIVFAIVPSKLSTVHFNPP